MQHSKYLILMNTCEGARLAEFSAAIRDSTRKRLHRVPLGFENWRIAATVSSFTDLARHLIGADDWLFDRLTGKTPQDVTGYPKQVDVADRAEFDGLLERLEEIGRARAARLGEMQDSLLAQHVCDPLFGEVTIWWVIVRGNLDHEIHHRGQIAAYLQVLRVRSES